jgi:cell division protein ZapA (FtsZ GTPase activity inhibitor)
VTDDTRESVTVSIAGEEHTIRSSAKPEYTERCAAYVDRRFHEIKKLVGPLEGNKLAILAALSITDELLQAQDTQEQSGSHIAERVNELAARLEGIVSGD